MKKILFLLAIALLGIGFYAFAEGEAWDGTTTIEPEKNTDGAYVVTNGAELAWLAAKSNEAASTFTIVINNDIDLGNKKWTPIGQKQYFNGNIEGNGHTIKGLYLVPGASATCFGLVGKMNSSKSYIKDLTIEGVMNVAEEYTSSQCDLGSLIGLANAVGTVENCHSYVNISVTAEGKAANYMGGLIGRAKAMNLIGCSYSGTMTIGESVTFNKGWGGVCGTFNSGTSGATTVVRNCWFDGKITNTAQKAPSYGAAIIGFPALTQGSFTMENCYAAGTFNTNASKGIAFTTFNTPTMTVGNNYAVDYTIDDENVTKLTSDQAKSGELCWRLNGDQTNRAFGQDLGSEDLPKLIAETKAVNRIVFNVEGAEYAVKYVNDAVALPAAPSKEDYTFDGWYDAETEGNKIEEGAAIAADMTLFAHFTEVPKDIWDGETLTEPQKNEQGVYVITTGAELAWIAAESNKGEVYAESIVIDKNIDLGGKLWTPIGQNNYYNGSIDGQGHYIKGLYIRPEGAVDYTGLVGQMNSKTASISALTIYGEMILPETTSNNSVGSLIGFANALGKVTNCHSFVNVTDSTANGGYLGGLAGRVKATTFEGCSYEGTLIIASGASFTKGWGGIVGTFNSTTSGATGGLSNSWMSGTITCESTADYKYKGALVGYPALTKGTCTIENNYAISEYPAFGAAASTTVVNNNFTLAATDSYATQTTMDQIHSGELCHMLGEAFGQNLKDAESYPVARTEDNQVFKVTFMFDGSEYATAYTNGTITLPETDPTKGTETFTGWYDSATGGNQYKNGDAITADITLYAQFYNKESDGKIRILAIGNSFTVDAVEDYLAPIIHSTGQDVIIGYPYKGGTTLEQHMGYINTNNAIYNYRKIEAGKDTYVSKGTTIMKTAITDEPWDYVIIQTDHNYSGVYSHYFPYLTDLITYVKENISNPTAKFFLYMTWAYDEGSTYSAFSNYNNDQMTMYNAIVDCAFKAATEAGIETVIPTGTAIQNCRSTYIGQNMNRDGYHLNYNYGRYVAGLSWAKSILGINPETVTFHPNTITDNTARLCQEAVNLAYNNPKAPTSMAEKWGTNPDIKNDALARPIFISFDSKNGNECAGSYWNVLSSASSAGQLNEMVDNKFVKTSAKIAIINDMTAGYTEGVQQTITDWDMPSAVSSSAFTATDTAKMIISGLRAGQAYDFGVFASYTIDGANLEAKYTFTGTNEASATLDAANNDATIAWANDVVADEFGRVVFTFVATENNTAKLAAINAMAINPHLTAPGDVPVYINLTDAANVATDWNNITENTVGAGVENMVNAYKESTGFGIKITKAFAGVNENGATSTTADFAMPTEASKTAYWVNGVEKEGVLVNEAELEITGLDKTKTYNFCLFASQTDNTETYEAEYTAIGENNRFITLNANGNTSKTSWINGITPDADGKIRITVTPGPSSIDTYKVGYLNTIMMTYEGMVQIDPNAGIPERPEVGEVWDGETVVEPLRGANDWYIITNGAELAWISQTASKATFSGNIVITNDIDLGNHKWTPIGNATQYYNGSIEGKGHTIKGLYLAPAKGDLCSGLVGATNSTGFIQNLNLEGKIYFSGAPTGSNQDVGSFVGLGNALSTLKNCHSNVDIDGTLGIGLYTGGLMGRIKAVNVDQCSYSGNIIAGKNNSKGGWGGLVGTFNSSVDGAKGGITNSWFDGTITCSASGAFVYGAALCGYANLSKGTCTIDNNYINGSISITGTTPTNYGIICGKAVSTTKVSNIYGVDLTGTNLAIVTTEQLHNGELARMLNKDNAVGPFGQDMSNTESFPVVFADSIAVFKTTYIADNDTTVKYNNAALLFPETPAKEGYDFIGWFDSADGGNQYTDIDEVTTDLTLYAHFEQVTGIDEVQGSKFQVQGSAYNLQGVRVDQNYKGIVIKSGKKYYHK